MAQDEFLNEIKEKVIRKLLEELFQSIRSNNIEALHIVLKSNINVDSIYEDKTALSLACMLKNYEIVCILIDEYKADPFSSIYKSMYIIPPLHAIVYYNYENSATKFIDKIMSVENSDINFLDYNEMTAFLYCIVSISVEVNENYKCLINRYNANFCFPSIKNTIFDKFNYSNEEVLNKLVEFLMDSDESFINIRDTRQNYNGYTFLHHAVRKVNYKLIKILIQKFNIDVKYDNNGNYPIHLAVDSGNLELVEYLCELGANLKIENSQTRRTPYELVQSDEIRTYFSNIVDIKSIAKSNFDELLSIINNCHRNLKMIAPIQWISSVSLQNLNFLTNLTDDYKIICSNYYLIYKHLLNNNSSIFNKDLPFYQLIKKFLILEDKVAHQNYFKILDVSKPYYALKNVCPFY